MQDANAYLELVHELTLMNEITRRYWKAACSETGTCSLGEGSRKSATVTWQLVGFLSYIEAHFGIMRRLADYYLNKAPTIDEMKKAHRKFIRDYNCQIHFAHRERQDNRHSPQDVLRGVLARLSRPPPWPAFSLRQSLPATWIGQDIFVFADGASMRKPG